MSKFIKINLLLLAGALAAVSSRGETATNAASNLSFFLQPANPKEGRDPFFPESSRPYAVLVVTNASPMENLAIKGFSGTEQDRTVIINNHSFGVGDEGDVLTSSGRIHLRCLVINSNSVVIEADHLRRELMFSPE